MLAMTGRKPTILRWSEEAEANHMREWAELEGAALSEAGRPEFRAGQCPSSSDGAGPFSRFWVLLRGRNPRIIQDG
jgi:hypothetical protein